VRWVLLTDDHPPMVGGVSVIVARIAAELVRRGDVVRVFARRRAGITEIPGTRLSPVWGPSFGRFGGRWLAARGVRAILGADRVLASTWAVGTGLPRLGVPYDVLGHGSDLTRRPRDPAAFRRVWEGASGRWVMSRFLASQLPYDDVGVLPAPVPLAAAPRALGDGRRWALIARATPLKGGDRFVRWVAAADVDGVIVGDGPELGAWKALAASLGARISFPGACSPERALADVDLVVLVPRADADGGGAEGFGLALVEAAGVGVPVVGCRTGGVPEAVGPGLLVDDPDDVRASVDAIRGFWTPDRGADAWRWCGATHGIERAVSALRSYGGNGVAS
jgi:glycosyltransferase involved in cell wall biosynthesis